MPPKVFNVRHVVGLRETGVPRVRRARDNCVGNTERTGACLFRDPSAPRAGGMGHARAVSGGSGGTQGGTLRARARVCA